MFCTLKFPILKVIDGLTIPSMTPEPRDLFSLPTPTLQQAAPVPPTLSIVDPRGSSNLDGQKYIRPKWPENLPAMEPEGSDREERESPSALTRRAVCTPLPQSPRGI